jgi:hypothetical protein
MEIPIHMLLEKERELKIRERERIKRLIQKHVTAPTLLQQIMQDIDREVEVQENG